MSEGIERRGRILSQSGRNHAVERTGHSVGSYTCGHLRMWPARSPRALPVNPQLFSLQRNLNQLDRSVTAPCTRNDNPGTRLLRRAWETSSIEIAYDLTFADGGSSTRHDRGRARLPRFRRASNRRRRCGSVAHLGFKSLSTRSITVNFFSFSHFNACSTAFLISSGLVTRKPSPPWALA
jgi:hypothetical protein